MKRIATLFALLAAEERHELFRAHVLPRERHASQRHALPVQRGVEHLVVLVERERGRGGEVIDASAY